MQHLAFVLGKSRVTVQCWLRQYTEGGLNRLLEQHPRTGRPKITPQPVRERLLLELTQPERFESYREVQTWLKASEDIDASYRVVHDTVRYQLKAKLKVPHPQSVKQSPEAKANLKKTASTTRCHPEVLSHIKSKPKDSLLVRGRKPFWTEDNYREKVNPKSS